MDGAMRAQGKKRDFINEQNHGCFSMQVEDVSLEDAKHAKNGWWAHKN